MSARFRISTLVASSALASVALLLSSSACSSGGGTGTGGSGGVVPGGSGGSTVGSGGANVGTGGGTLSSGGAIGSGGLSSGSGGATGGGTGTGGTGTGGGTASGGQAGSGGTSGGLVGYNPDFKEFAGEDCVLPEPALLSSPDHSLPDPFLMSDGTRMSSLEQWACQRAWLKKNVEAFVHGEKPGRPETVTGSVTASSISVHVENGGQSHDFAGSAFTITRPQGAAGPTPGMFQADGSGVPTNFLSDEGVAAIRYDHGDIEAAYDKLYGGSGVSLNIKWAWGVSRAIDVLVDEAAAGNNDIIDPTALGTTGCSYAGKSAFSVGAFDERIALGIPVESGSGGLASYRVIADNDFGPNKSGDYDPEAVSAACSSNWLEGAVCNGNVDGVPADAHFMVAMYAPRGFTTLDNDRIGHLAPVAQFAALSAGAEVFKALGLETHVGYHGGNDGDPHMHCGFYESQEETARKAIQGFLTKTAAPANFMEPKLKDYDNMPVDFDLANYIDWAVPPLK